MTGRLSAALVEQYRRDGFLSPVHALTPDQARHYRERFEAFEASQAGVPKEELHHRAFRFKPHLLHTWLDELIHLPNILDAVEDVIGPDILVWSSSFFVKDAHDPGFVSWHQDSTTYGLVGSDLVTAWLALTDSDPGNASMRVIPGSHHLGDLPHRDTFVANNVLSRGETVELDIDERQAVAVSLRAGEMSLHHLRVVHGSPANTSDRRRIGYAIRYMAPHMRPAAGRASALLVRGRDAHGHFEPEPRPQRDFDEAALAAYERAMQLRTSAVFQDAPIKR
jgi:ectoine hydroxylase-related dioxygenase (phytanoyl-CoA dioxygenase family)